MISGYISLKTVIAKLYRTLGINEEIPEINIVEWASEALDLIGAFGQYEIITDCIELNSGKAKLPCSFYKLQGVNFKGHPLHWATQSNANNYQCSDCQIPVCQSGGCDYTFYLNDSYIITNIGLSDDTDQNICLTYLSIPVDENGWPLIPSDIYYQKAIESFIIHMLDYQEFRKGKITDKVFEKSESNWLFYVNSARASALMPNIAQLERLKNVWRKLLPNTNSYNRGFTDLGKQERLNLS